MPIIAAAIIGGATIYTASKSSEAQSEATGASTAAADKAADIQWKMFQKNQENQLPWLQAGRESLGTLQERVAAGPGEFEASPGYKFALEQGNKNLMQQAAATGGTQSGATLKALQDYGQKSASTEYDRFLNRYYQSLNPLQSMAGVGQTTAQNIGAAGQNVAGNLSNIYQAQGAAQGQGAINQANIQTGTLQNLANLGGAFMGNRTAATQVPNSGSGAGQEWDTSSIEALRY